MLKSFETCKHDSQFVHFIMYSSSIGTFGCALNDSIICLGWYKTVLQRKTQISAKQYQLKEVNSQASSGEIRLFEWRLIFDDVAGMSFIPNARG